jgi:hypothetical protein
MKCQACHRTVTRKSKFCPDCGERIVPRTTSKKVEKKPAFSLPYAVGLIAIGLLIGYLIFKENAPGDGAASGFQNSEAVQSAIVTEIAQQFDCTCGQCTHSLEECDCAHPGGAQEVKGFIVQKIQERHHTPHIVEMVQQQFGGLKSQPMPELNLDPSSK